MSTKEILVKRQVDEYEMAKVVEDYILVRKGVSVKVVPSRNGFFNAQNEYVLLSHAFTEACEWFAHNPHQVP